jgi:o-succinylbenzoate synthase
VQRLAHSRPITERLPALGEGSPAIRVRRVTLHLVDLPLVSRFRTAYGTATRKRTVLVRLEDADGVVGWGEAPGAELPLYAADTTESTWYALTTLLAPRVAGRELANPAALAGCWAGFQGHRYATHALECAGWAVASEKLGRPLAEVLGGVRTAIAAGESFGIRDAVADLLAEIEERLAEGFVRVKLKIEPGWDADVARQVCEAFPGTPVTVDGNCGYRTAEAEPWRALDELGLLMIEQPLPADELVPMAELQGRLRTPLCLDEAAATPGTTAAALRLGAGRVVNVKPARLGGLLPSLAVHDLCRELDVPVWCGGMLETGIGRAFNLALASLPGFTLPADMSPARLFYAEDLVEPTFDVRRDGTIEVPRLPGVGFPVREDRIARYTTATWSSA